MVMAADNAFTRFLHRLPPPLNWLIKGTLLQRFLSWEVLSLLLLWADLATLHKLSNLHTAWAFWTFYTLAIISLSLFFACFFFAGYIVRILWNIAKSKRIF